MKKAKITELFSSIQGEGLYVGKEQFFVRFYGCNLSCKFCDENRKKDYLLYGPSELAERIASSGRKTVSLTGGEPLLHADFLKEMLSLLKNKGFRIYLETNGTLKDELLKVLDYIDIVSMDLKLPSSTGIGEYWKEHAEFLRGSVKKEVFTKVVITPVTGLCDIEKAVSIVKDVDENIPFIIQPVSYNGSIAKIDLLDTFFNRAKMFLNEVRVIPQIHKIIGVR